MLIFCFGGFIFTIPFKQLTSRNRAWVLLLQMNELWISFKRLSLMLSISHILYQAHFLCTNQSQPKIRLIKSNFPCRSQFSFHTRSLITQIFGGWREQISALWLLITWWLSTDIFRSPTNSPFISMYFQLCSFQSSTIPRSSLSWR